MIDVDKEFAGTGVLRQQHDQIVERTERQSHDAIAEKKTHAQILLELAAGIELFHGPDGQAFATVPIGDHFETWPLKSAGFARWIKKLFYEREGKPPSNQTFGDSLAVLEAKAVFDGNEHATYVRVAERRGNIYLDLADSKWRAIEITPTGWHPISNPPVKFVRHNGMMPIPMPSAGGSVGALKKHINCPDDNDLYLIVGWLMGVLQGQGPFAILALQGEHGNAKSTAARMLKKLVDPSKANVRSAPRSEHDLIISAHKSRALCFDNLSGIPPWLSDALCRLSTGGGFSTRELYSDSEEVIYDVQRPVLLNGIDDYATRQDLIDRVVAVQLPKISEQSRRPESEIWADFEEDRPAILGALLDGVSVALSRVDQVKLERQPRMADFTRWVTAAEPGLGWKDGAFLRAYAANRTEAIETGLESDYVAVAVRHLMSGQELWEGTATELLDELALHTKDEIKRGRCWPKNNRSLSNRVRRIAPALRAGGLTVEFERETTGAKRKLIVLKRRHVETTDTSDTSDAADNARPETGHASAALNRSAYVESGDPLTPGLARENRSGDEIGGASSASVAKKRAFSRDQRDDLVEYREVL